MQPGQLTHRMTSLAARVSAAINAGPYLGDRTTSPTRVREWFQQTEPVRSDLDSLVVDLEQRRTASPHDSDLITSLRQLNADSASLHAATDTNSVLGAGRAVWTDLGDAYRSLRTHRHAVRESP